MGARASSGGQLPLFPFKSPDIHHVYLLLSKLGFQGCLLLTHRSRLRGERIPLGLPCIAGIPALKLLVGERTLITTARGLVS